MTLQELQQRYIGEGEIHFIGEAANKIVVHYRKYPGNSTGAMEQAAVMHEFIADAAPVPVEFINAPRAKV